MPLVFAGNCTWLNLIACKDLCKLVQRMINPENHFKRPELLSIILITIIHALLINTEHKVVRSVYKNDQQSKIISPQPDIS